MTTGDTPLIQSVVWYRDRCFLVSTIDRSCSAALSAHGVYAETIAWVYEAQQRGGQIGQWESVEHAIDQHLSCCQQLHTSGTVALINEGKEPT